MNGYCTLLSRVSSLPLSSPVLSSRHGLLSTRLVSHRLFSPVISSLPSSLISCHLFSSRLFSPVVSSLPVSSLPGLFSSRLFSSRLFSPSYLDKSNIDEMILERADVFEHCLLRLRATRERSEKDLAVVPRVKPYSSECKWGWVGRKAGYYEGETKR